jgi:hypothetical protein
VGRERYLFDGLEGFERRLRRVAGEVGYLVVWDRTDRHNEDNLGRFELTAHDALPYLEGAEELVDEPDEDDDEADDDSDLEAAVDDRPAADEPPERQAERLMGRAAGPADYAVAAGRWLRDIAIRNMGGDEARRFRVRAYAPKGTRVVDTGSYVCKDDDHDPDLPVLAVSAEAVVREPELRIPTPTFDQVETVAAGRGMKALGDYYAQWGQIVLGSVGQLQGVNNAMLGRMHRQLDQSRDQVDQLVAAILTAKVTEAELSEQRRSTERTDDARTELARHALQQLGDAAKAFMTAKGVTPEMADALGVIGQSPDMLDALQDPDVRALMQDPNHLRLVAGMLKQAGAQARAMRGAAVQTPLAKAS